MIDCCELHKTGKYNKWKCSTGYSPKERSAIFLSKKHKCLNCDRIVTAQAKRCTKCCRFQIENASYNAKHRWLQRNIKKPLDCQHCGEVKKLQWANISKEYKRDPSDYIALCIKCHCKFDNNYPHLNKKKGQSV